jgi:hypothetical protein
MFVNKERLYAHPVLHVVLRMASVGKMFKIFLVHTLKAYRASVDIAVLMPDLGTRWK